jgi:hypothetical protein
MKLDLKNQTLKFLGISFNFKIHNPNNVNYQDYIFNYVFIITQAEIDLNNDKILIPKLLLEHKYENKVLNCSIQISENDSQFIILNEIS